MSDLKRTIVPLKDGWTFVKEGEESAVCLPHTWNAKDGQDGGNDYYRGTCRYVQKLKRPEVPEDACIFLEIAGAAMSARVFWDGELLASHRGGYSAFRVDLTGRLSGEERELCIEVDNSDNTDVYPQKADFTFYGGLYREVSLIVVPAVHFDLSYCGAPGIKVTPVVDLAEKKAVVTVETWQVGEGDVTVSVDGQSKTVTPENGCGSAEFTIEKVHLWDGVDDPYLYTARASLASGDEVCARFGCRAFEIDPQRGFLLNGRNYPLRGVSRHQDCRGVGPALAPEHHRRDMELILEIGANTLRLAHYQHAQEFYDLCDENGIIVWAEIPYITMHMKDGRENTLTQMEELIAQCYNHPSIVVWGLSNEITAASPVNDDLLENHRLLNELCHKMDKTRLTTMANVFMLETDSPILDIPDVNSYNLYFGWYLGELSQNDEFFDEFHRKYPDRPIGFSEYGAHANPQFQSPAPEKNDYTEGYQALYHEHMLAMIEARPWLWATHVWNMFDFAADGRDEGGKHGENQKGLVTFDRQTKKDAFYLYKAAWNKAPMVHICGRRYAERPEAVTEIKVYSNAEAVTLYVDGVPVETKQAARIFRFDVPINGVHTIEARAGGLSDTIEVRRSDEMNKDYVFVKKQDVVNWFDQDDFDPDCFSVSDTLAELQANPKAGAVVNELMAKAAASRGDVASAVKDNPGLQRMMGRMTLIGLLKQAGNVDGESVKQLNRILQGIRK